MTTPAEPAVPVFPAGYAPTQSFMTADIQTPFEFLTTKVMLRAELQGSQSLVSGFNLIEFGATGGDILEDPYGGWSTSSTSHQQAWSWLCPAGCSGLYEITITAFMANPGTNTDLIQSAVYVDNALYMQTSSDWGVDGHATGTTGSIVIPLLGGGDYVQGYAWTTVSNSTVATNGQYPTMEIVWVSAYA
jgi:hypothetical protein